LLRPCFVPQVAILLQEHMRAVRTTLHHVLKGEAHAFTSECRLAGTVVQNGPSDSLSAKKRRGSSWIAESHVSAGALMGDLVDLFNRRCQEINELGGGVGRHPLRDR